MPYQYPEIRKFLGLFAQPNSFGLPDGAMEKALNVVINDDDVVSKIRGFYRYYSPGSGTIKQLATYQNKLFAIYDDKLAYYTDTGSSPNETGVQSVLSGQAVSLLSKTAHFVESNGNLYFTTDKGIYKLDAYNGTIYLAGAPIGLDFNGGFLPSNGVVGGNASVAYRAVFGRKDANNNTILGAPSDIVTLYNNKLTGASYTSGGPGPYTVTVTAANNNLTPGMTVTITNATNSNANGSYVVASASSTQFTYIVSASPASGTLDWDATRTPLLELSVPSEVMTATDKWFVQIYRTSQAIGASPTADFKLVDEHELTAGEITAGVVFYEDTTEDILIEFSPFLYTNENSREGEDQANYRAPLVDDIALFQNHLFFANAKTRHWFELDVVDPSKIASGDTVFLKVGATVRQYVARSGVGNTTTPSVSVYSSSGDLVIELTGHNLANGYRVYVSGISGGTLAEGEYFVVGAAANTIKLSLTSGGPAVAYNSESFLFVQGVDNGTYPIFTVNNTSLSISTQLQLTSQGLVKAINRDASSLVYANYASQITDTPGKMRIQAIGFGDAIEAKVSSSTTGEGFFPVLTTSYVAQSTNDTEPNAVYFSKVGEPEAVPLLNKLVVGSANKKIYRILDLRNAIIVLKEDGIFKITGDSPSNFAAVLLDNTVSVLSARSAHAIANRVYFLSTGGVCIASDSSVDIVSRRIENVFRGILGLSNLDSETAAIAYTSDRSYRISTIGPNDTTNSVVYIYNTLNDTWTQSDIVFTAAVVGPNNTLYQVSGNKILKERKNGNRIDYCGQNYSCSVVSVASDKMSAVISSADVPMVGDIIVKNNVFSRISAVATSGANYLVNFYFQTNLVAADSLSFYRYITSEIKMAPFHAGAVGRSKQFSQFQVHTRTPSITRTKISFSGPYFGGSDIVEWLATLVSGSGGWGELPWGLFNWGLDDGIKNQYNTVPAPIIRTYVPLFQQRSTFIQAIMTHAEAGESMDIQAIAWSVRGYNERVTK